MILVVFGTTGELIKLAPVLLGLEARGHRYLLATTGHPQGGDLPRRVG